MKEYKSNLPEIELRYKKGEVQKCKIKTSKDAYDVFMKFYQEDVFALTESVIVLFLNSANNTIGWMKHSSGGMLQCVIDTRLIYATALKCGATSIVVSHNHPSGQLWPSKEDTYVTDKLKEGSKYLGIALLDHIIACEDGYYSFADEGKL